MTSRVVDDRSYPERPIAGVLAVARRRGRVLLAQRAKAPRPGLWGFVGGVQEVGETVLAAAARELREETGIEAESVAVLTALDMIGRDEAGRVRTHFTLVAVLADWRSGEAAPDADALALGWFTPEEVEERRMPCFPDTLRLMRMALALP